MKMRTIHPHKTETYQVAIDDGCLVVRSGSNPKSPKVYLSKSMCKWIGENAKRR